MCSCVSGCGCATSGGVVAVTATVSLTFGTGSTVWLWVGDWVGGEDVGVGHLRDYSQASVHRCWTWLSDGDSERVTPGYSYI
jgi:hypothetical protein